MSLFIMQSLPPTRRSGVYVRPLAPARSLGATPSDVLGLVFTANRGPLDTAVPLASLPDFEAIFGRETPDPTPGRAGLPLSGWPDVAAIKAQGAYALLGVRVADATVSTAYVTLVDANGDAILTLHAATPGTWANSLSAATRPTTQTPGLFDLTIADNATGQSETIPALSPANNAALIKDITRASTLVNASQPVLDAPTVAPTVTAGTGGTLAAGVYSLIGAWTTATGETTGSPATIAVTVPADGEMTVLMPAPAPSAAVGFKIFSTRPNGAPGTQTYAGTGTPGQPLVLSAPWPPATATPAPVNTATIGAGSTNAPAAGPFVVGQTGLSGTRAGADGANASAARHVGAPATDGRATGAHVFATLPDGRRPNIAWAAGDAGSDPAQFGAWAQLAYENGWWTPLAIPRGTPASQAAAFAQSVQVQSVAASPAGGWVSLEYPWYETTHPLGGAETLAISPATVAAAVTAIQAPNASGANKPVSSGDGFEITGLEVDLSDSQVEAFLALDINAHTAHIPADGLGREKDYVLGTDLTGTTPGRGSATRMANLLARGVKSVLSSFAVEEVNDPTDLWPRIEAAGDAYLNLLASLRQIPGNDPGTTTASATGQTVSQPLATTTRVTPARTTTSVVTSTGSSAAGQTGASQLNYALVCDTTTNGAGTPVGVVRCRLYATLFGIAEQLVIDFGLSLNTGQVAVGQ